MAENENEAEASGLTRRQLIKRAAIVGGAAVWAAPVIRMAMGSGGPDTVNIGGAQLIVDGPCSATGLDGPTTTRTVCASSLAKAKTAYKTQVTTDCTGKCGARGPCTAPNTCLTAKRGGVTIGTITCVGPGPDCPVPPYATGTKEYVCTAAVTCNCVCRT